MGWDKWLLYRDEWGDYADGSVLHPKRRAARCIVKANDRGRDYK